VNLTLNDRTFSTKQICIACKISLQNGKVPQFTTPDQIRRNKHMPVVSTSSELEERLVSLRISFAHIRPWGYRQSQMGLTRSIVNVHVHIDVVQKAFPQFMDETMTIVDALKRQLQYKNAYKTGGVRVNIVMRELK